MASLSPQVKTALGRYWSEIFGGAALKLNTQDIFANIRERATELGLSSVGVGANTISTLRGFAGRMLNAATRLNAQPDNAPMTASLFSEAPWSRSLGDQNVMPLYHVSFDHTVETDSGDINVLRHTIVITGALPGTVGGLRGLIEDEAQLMAAEGSPDSEGTPHGISLGVDNLMITAV